MQKPRQVKQKELAKFIWLHRLSDDWCSLSHRFFPPFGLQVLGDDYILVFDQYVSLPFFLKHAMQGRIDRG